MTDDRPLVLHVGLSKTGTTTLQRRVFPTLTSYDVAGVPRSGLFDAKGYRSKGVLRLAFERSPVVWSSIGPDILRAAADAAGAEIGAGPLLLSDEGISSRRCPYALGAHLAELSPVARRLGYTSVRCVYVIRRQDRWLGSFYAQTSDRRGRAGQADFEAFIRRWTDPAHGRYMAAGSQPCSGLLEAGASLDYGMIYDQITSAIGPESTLVLAYEDLAASPATFVRRLTEFLGETEASDVATSALNHRRDNVRSSGSESWSLRPMDPDLTVRLRPSRVFARLGLPAKINLRRFRPGREDRVKVTDEIRRLVLDAYEETNRHVSRVAGLDLSRLGYFPTDTRTGP